MLSLNAPEEKKLKWLKYLRFKNSEAMVMITQKEYDTVTFQQKAPKIAITMNYTLNLKAA